MRDRFQESRADRFVALLRPRAGGRLLDLGGGDGSLAARVVRRVSLDVTVADASLDNREVVLRRGFRHVLLEPEQPLPFAAGDFDYVLCNSVIEHVTLPKERCAVNARVPEREWVTQSRAAQRRFAEQVRALGTSYFVQTPHRHFPIDQHVHLPLVHYLPHNAVCRVVAVTDRWWVKTCYGLVDWELLTPRLMRELFPDATITIERFAGLPKSIIAWSRAGPAGVADAEQTSTPAV